MYYITVTDEYEDKIHVRKYYYPYTIATIFDQMRYEKEFEQTLEPPKFCTRKISLDTVIY